MDDRIVSILRTLARGDLSTRNDGFLYFCPHCSFESDYVEEPVPHDDACIVRVARSVLRDMGQPMRLYKMEWELHGPMDTNGYVHIGAMSFSSQRENYLYAQQLEDIDVTAVVADALFHSAWRTIRAEWKGIVEPRNITITLVCDV